MSKDCENMGRLNKLIKHVDEAIDAFHGAMKEELVFIANELEAIKKGLD